MKISVCVVFSIILIHGCDGMTSDVQDFVKFTKVTCSTSGKTCTKMSCKIKAINRYQTVANMDCEKFLRPLTDWKFHARMWKINLAGNQRQIVDLHDIPACAVVDNLQLFPMLTGVFNWLNTTFPGCVHKCPYEGFKCFNATLKLNLNPKAKWLTLPNGKYKLLLKISDDKDDNIISFTLWSEVNYHFRETEFK